jgi:hypothetical protein
LGSLAEKEKERRSVDKRAESIEKIRSSMNVRAGKGMSISSKIMQEKSKEDKNKVLKHRLGFE